MPSDASDGSGAGSGGRSASWDAHDQLGESGSLLRAAACWATPLETPPPRDFFSKPYYSRAMRRPTRLQSQ
jgi:hypothetical protein